MPTDLTLLFAMSAPRRAVDRIPELNHSAPSDREQLPPSADASVPRLPDPRRHSVVCCCLRCELHGTGEQAMREVGGDYARFLARVASPISRSDGPGGSSVTKPPRRLV